MFGQICFIFILFFVSFFLLFFSLLICAYVFVSYGQLHSCLRQSLKNDLVTENNSMNEKKITTRTKRIVNVMILKLNCKFCSCEQQLRLKKSILFVFQFHRLLFSYEQQQWLGRLLSSFFF